MDAAQHAERLARARVSLEGLSVGDAFGENFFIRPELVYSMVRERAVPKPPWYFTDDTNMALSIFANLREYGTIRQDELAGSFAEHYDYRRGYGHLAAANNSKLCSIFILYGILLV